MIVQVGGFLEAWSPTTTLSLPIRVVLGPQDDRFTQAGLDVLFGESFTVSANSDRMGYRLQGPKVEHSDGPDIISDGIPFGGVQVSGDGQPIILMADRGTSGGYTKPATVISSDIGKVAQRMPGDEIRFQSVTLAEAHEALRSQEAAIAQAKEHLAAPISRRRFTSNRRRRAIPGRRGDSAVGVRGCRSGGGVGGGGGGEDFRGGYFGSVDPRG